METTVDQKFVCRCFTREEWDFLTSRSEFVQAFNLVHGTEDALALVEVAEELITEAWWTVKALEPKTPSLDLQVFKDVRTSSRPG
jgi:hypothetical protein